MRRMTTQKIERIGNTFFYELKKEELVKLGLKHPCIHCAKEMAAGNCINDHLENNISRMCNWTLQAHIRDYIFNKRICSYQRFLIGT